MHFRNSGILDKSHLTQIKSLVLKDLISYLQVVSPTQNDPLTVHYGCRKFL